MLRSESEVPIHKGVFEHLPKAVFDSVIINDSLRGKFANPLMEEMLLDPDFIFRTAGVFSLQASTASPTSSVYPVPESSVRAALLRRFMDPVVVDGYAYTELTAKGTGLSPRYRDKHLLPRHLQYDFDDIPIGFFGFKKAVKEMEISNFYADIGIRTGRVVGILKINPRRFQRWLESHQSELGPRYKILRKHLKRVIANEDVPAIVVRLTHPRYEDMKPRPMRPTESSYLYSTKNIVTSCLDGHRAEIKARGGSEKFLACYKINDSQVGLKTFVNKLEMVGEDPNILSLSKEYEAICQDRVQLNTLEAYLHAFNIGRYARLLSRSPNRRYILGVLPAQDESVEMYWNDYENTARLPQYMYPGVIPMLRAHALETGQYFDQPDSAALKTSLEEAFDRGKEE